MEKDDRPAANVKKTAAETKKDANDMTDAILAGFNMIAVMTTNIPEAKLTDEEAAALREPLERIMKRMTPETTERFRVISDPVIVLAGLGFWAARVLPLVNERKKQDVQPDSSRAYAPDFTNSTRPDPSDGTRIYQSSSQ